MHNILPTTRSLLALLKQDRAIHLKKNVDRKTPGILDKVFDDFKRLAKDDESLRIYETQEPYEMIIMIKDRATGLPIKIPSFII